MRWYFDDVRRELRAGFGDVRNEMRGESGELRGELRSESGELRSALRALRLRVDAMLLATIGLIATLAVKL